MFFTTHFTVLSKFLVHLFVTIQSRCIHEARHVLRIFVDGDEIVVAVTILVHQAVGTLDEGLAVEIVAEVFDAVAREDAKEVALLIGKFFIVKDELAPV